MPWSKAAQTQASNIEKDFKGNLRQIADCLAAHDRATQVAPAHVDRAFECLSTHGLCRRPWLDRVEARTSVGGAAIGLAFALPDVIATLLPKAPPGLASACVISFILIGVFLVVDGWYQGTLPVPRDGRSKWYRWTARVLLILFGICVALLCGYLLYQYFLGEKPGDQPAVPVVEELNGP